MPEEWGEYGECEYGRSGYFVKQGENNGVGFEAAATDLRTKV